MHTLQDKLKLEADIKLLIRAKDRALNDLTSIEEQLKKRTIELSGDVKKLTIQKKTLLEFLQIHYKTLAMYEDIIDRVKRGVLTFGSDEYEAAKDKADKHLHQAEGILSQADSKLTQAKQKETLLNVKEKGLSVLKGTLNKEKANLEIEATSMRQEKTKISQISRHIVQTREKVDEDMLNAEKLLKEAKNEHFQASTKASEKLRQADEILGIIKVSLSDVKLERERIKAQQDFLVRKDEELKAIAIRLTYRKARLK